MDRTIIKLDPELGRRLKVEAARNGTTMREIVGSLVLAWLTAAVPSTLPQTPGAAPGHNQLDDRRKPGQLHRRKQDRRI